MFEVHLDAKKVIQINKRHGMQNFRDNILQFFIIRDVSSTTTRSKMELFVIVVNG